jgi:anaphase-promoting complex subunit 5
MQPGLHPIELLFDVEKLLRVNSVSHIVLARFHCDSDRAGEQEQPLSAAFEKMIQAVGLCDHWIDVQGNYLDYADQWSQHTVQSIVWSAAGAGPGYRTLFCTNAKLGCEKLAVIEESIVTAFSEIGGDSNNALVVTLNRAYRVRSTALRRSIY